jgi:starch phosphorylase
MSHPGDHDVARAADALAARLPPALGVLARLAYNYRWSWTPGGPELFESVDPYRWATCRENPVRLLQESSFVAAGRGVDPDLVLRAEALESVIAEDLARPPSTGSNEHPVAFLCAEYGVHRSLPTYSGGLGVLAGDLLKEASDQAVPMVGVGILYRQGTYHQHIDLGGWQHEYWTESDPDRLPAALMTGEDGLPLTVGVPLRGREVMVQVWRVDVGRVPLYLLDAQRPENSRADRWITARLYVGDRQVRLAQYALLGMGGIRVLRALGIEPAVVHLNEGHAGLAPVELAARDVEAGAAFDSALASARERTVFTTHTPVAAGNESYGAEELYEALGDLPGRLGVDEQRFLALGRVHPDDRDEAFGVTPLGIRVSRSSNAVSRRHGDVAREMWQPLFPDRPAQNVPIGHVTNGVHVPTWMAPAMQELLDAHLPEGWRDRQDDPATWKAIDAIPDADLWAVRNRLRSGLVDYVRDRTVGDRLAREESTEYAEAAAQAFDPAALTIGFARRVAGYKRLDLLIRDPGRALRLLEGDRPVQFVLAGKAHPQDESAKRILQAVFGMKWETHVAERVAFLEDYDMGMAAQLVRGCDVWVNVPRPPFEASGTSGMKAALNGGLNLSVLDGWWDEAFDGTNGWGFAGDQAPDPGARDDADAGALYDLLENDVVPLFHDRDGTGIPEGWVDRMRSSLRTVCGTFCASRTLRDYVTTAYRLGPARGEP